MIVTKPIDLRINLKSYLDNGFDGGSQSFVSLKNNRNVVIFSECEYNDLMKAKQNVGIWKKLQHGISALDTGKGI